MKSIVIRQLTLLNFKGIRNLTVDFDLNETNIFGYNGTGKTTIFDAFTWLLFGKDSKDRKDFNIKTNSAASWLNLGIMAEQGQGGKVDPLRARECYSMAEKLGHPQAAEYLKRR